MSTMDAKQAAKYALGAYVGYAVYRKLAYPDQFAPIALPAVRKDSPKCLIVGAGFSGMCMSIKLALKGIDHLVVEKENDVGGTWLLSRYPGVQCDVPSHGYCYSFEMNPEWTQAYATSKEIWEYQVNVAKKYGVYNRARFNTEVISCKWNESDRKWIVEVENRKTGERETMLFDFVISGIGGLHVPAYPNVPGVGKFQGKEIHSAEWRDTIDITNKRVVVVGSAASAVQIVPSIVDQGAKQVYCLQRTPNWLAPQRAPILPWSLKYSPMLRWCFRNLPGSLYLHRILCYWMMEMVHSPLGLFSGTESSGQLIAKKALTKYMMHQLKGNTELAEKVIPKYAVGCKRIIRSERFLPALLKDNVELITEKFTRVEDNGIVVETKQGDRKIECDVLVYATGYHVGSLGRMELKGCHEHRMAGSEIMEKAVDTYYGMCHPEYPNSFLMLGPNTGLGHNSIIILLETQAEFVARVIELCADNKVDRITVKPDAVDKCMKFVNEALDQSVWKAGHCNSWYQNKDGKVPTIWPASTIRYMADCAPPSDLRVFDCYRKGQAMRGEVAKM